MSGRMARKIRKAIDKKLGHEWELLKQIIKPRPKWMPKWLWYLGLGIYFKSELYYFGNELDVPKIEGISIEKDELEKQA